MSRLMHTSARVSGLRAPAKSVKTHVIDAQQAPGYDSADVSSATADVSSAQDDLEQELVARKGMQEEESGDEHIKVWMENGTFMVLPVIAVVEEHAQGATSAAAVTAADVTAASTTVSTEHAQAVTSAPAATATGMTKASTTASTEHAQPATSATATDMTAASTTVAAVADTKAISTFKCELCQKTFVTKGNLKRHTTIAHTGNFPISCSLCNKGFLGKAALNQHTQVAHMGVTYKCTHANCEKEFTTKGNLSFHLNTHTQSFKHFCRYCGMGFYHILPLTTHENLHSGIKPYTCEKCSKTFNSKSVLSQHLKTCGVKVGIYSCDGCNKSFKCKIYLKEHQKIHTAQITELTCDICQKVYGHRSSFYKHKKSHK